MTLTESFYESLILKVEISSFGYIHICLRFGSFGWGASHEESLLVWKLFPIGQVYIVARAHLFGTHVILGHLYLVIKLFDRRVKVFGPLFGVTGPY